MAAKGALRPASPSTENLDRIKQRNQAIVEKKLQRGKESTAAEIERQERLSKLKQKVHVDIHPHHTVMVAFIYPGVMLFSRHI